MPRPIKPASRFWWWPRLSPGFIALCLALSGGFALLQVFHLGVGSYFLLACIWLPFGLLSKQRARLAKHVLTRPGVTCPCCLQELESDAPSCTRCNAGHSRAVYVDYWTLAANEPANAESWWRAQNQAADHRGRPTHLALQMRWQLGLLLGSLLLVMVGIVLWRPAMLLRMQWLWMLPLIATSATGVWIIATYGRKRAGDSTHCALCDYQIDPDRLGMAQCPECGGDLTGRDRTVVGRRIGHAGFTLLGVVVMALPIGLFLVSALTRSFSVLSPSNYLPVSIYVDDALGGDPDYQTWRVLESRYAKGEDLQRLAATLVLRLQNGSVDDQTLGLFRYDQALAFQLDGPNADEALRQRVAVALFANNSRVFLHELMDWLERHAKSMPPGSDEHRALIAAAQDAFTAGTLDFRLIAWLETQLGGRLQVARDLDNFIVYMLRLNHVTTDDGSGLEVRTNPAITLPPDQRPNRPMRVYLHAVGPTADPTHRTILDLHYDPIAALGQNLTLSEVPAVTNARGPVRHRLVFLVAVGDDLPDACNIEWSENIPLITPAQQSGTDWYGPYELRTGSPLATELRRDRPYY
ncbi:MAG: hypothetical protein AAGA29_09530 [Planctomycetota bacterium]